MTTIRRAMIAVATVFWAVPIVTAALAWLVVPQDEVEGCTRVAVFDCMSVRDTLRLYTLVLGPPAFVAGAVLLGVLAALGAWWRGRAARAAG
ncbi:hypothetical protein [Solicola sp. PLA-1-18]|uniref:hypothetical protein n=1 Tax=Solicola sp. PLA-1-18 TaxID=3380532 RepID=UPI003B767BE0